MKKKNLELLLTCFLWCVFNSFSAKGAPADSVELFFRKQLMDFPQEKLYLQTDRAQYAAGDTVWFRAYQVDAATHRPQVLSRYLYVELVDERDSVVQRIKVRPENEAFESYMALPLQISGGNYMVRAYTNFMRSLEEDYFFRKSLRIGRSATPTITDKNETYDVSFFPEGGNLPAGTFCRIGFKALGASGWAEEITGTIVDEEGKVITEIRSEHAGMGVFVLCPEAGKRYFAECKNGNGLSKRFALPVAEPDKCSLQVRMLRDKLRVSLLKSPALKGRLSGYSLVAQMRGQVYYAEKWDDSKEYVLFEESRFPTGVLQILLLDPDLNPVSERLVFCKNDDQGHVAFSTDKKKYGIRDRIGAAVKVSDRQGRPLAGSFSVAVTDDSDVRPDERMSIYSYLLLTSELRGHIESPAYYFAAGKGNEEDSLAITEEEKRLFQLDHLMLTQGWRRYEAVRILQKQYDTPSEDLEVGQVISGQVVRPLLRKGIRNAQVGIAAPEVGFARVVEADRDGRFLFAGFEWPDSTWYTLTGFTKNKGSHVEIVVDKQSFPSVTLRWPVERTEPDTVALDRYLAKAQRRSSYQDISHVIDLDEVVVDARKREPEIETSPLVKDPIATITYKEIEKFQPSDFAQVLQLMPQFHSMGRNLMIDGFFVEYSSSIVNVHDIARVDLIPAYRATIFGTLSEGGGVIAVTTKKGGEGLTERTFPNISFMQPLGYRRTVRFYSPAYETLEKKNFRIPDLRTTLYWNPDVRLSATGEGRFDFYSADRGTSYSVVIEGITEDGKTIFKRDTIIVE